MFSSNATQVASTAANYIESCFSTYLYSGNGSSQTITNEIDVSGKGGLVWIKQRNTTRDHLLFDTNRGATQRLFSNLTLAQSQDTQSLTAFTSSGFSIGSDSGCNLNGGSYASWTFAKQSKFFDVVTYTGTGANTTIAHNLGAVPGCIIVKRTDAAGAWQVYHRSLANTQYMVLNTTAAVATGATRWNSTTPTSTVFSVGTDATVNASGGTYVACLFAHDAGGFGLTGTDNVISCGSFTTDGSGNATVSLGYEPQWVLYKPSSAVNNWKIFDNMRGMVVGTGDMALYPNTSGAETQDDSIQPSATGFSIVGGDASATHIYIAIRRGPMKVPTDATKVFKPVAYTGDGNYNFTPTIGNFVVDMVRVSKRTASETYNGTVSDRLKGARSTLFTPITQAEATTLDWVVKWDKQNSVGFGTDAAVNESGASQILHAFSRAPSFFDQVCYTGTGATSAAFNHNLGAVPEMMIVKSRSNSSHWMVYTASQGNTKELQLERTNAVATNTDTWGSTTPTSTQFTVGCISGIPDTESTNDSGYTYVAYLFASCPGVSKVGSYTGNGTTQTIDCGFTGGARFVLIKRTDSTGDWYTYDTARGMTALTDPYLRLNSTAAEVATLGSVTTVSTGFALNSAILAAINASGGSYIFLAIA